MPISIMETISNETGIFELINRKAIQVYDEMMRKADYNKDIHVYKACCYYALCQYDDSKRECQKGPETPLQIRL